MAKLTFVGAAGTVTGSKHLVETNSRHFFVDCGMFQGPADVRALNEVPLPIAAEDVEAVVLTHGHIDHIGYLPKLVKDGFKGPVYCSPPTEALLEIVLEDAAGLQAGLQRHGSERGRERFHEIPPPAPPLYDLDDVAATLELVEVKPLHAAFDVCGATLVYKNAGHIIGSAFIEISLEGRRVVFSGDVGRYGRPLLYDPEDLDRADVIICESTYGDRIHPPDPLGDLAKALTDGIARGGPIVIPAFAVERTQDLLVAIGTLQRQEPRIAPLAVHVDSPMAIKVDALFAKFPDAHRPIPNSSPDAPFGCRNVTSHMTVDQSKELNALDSPAIVIAASGMASGGRILHHLHNQIPNPHATIIFCGFQSPGTLGNILVHSAGPASVGAGGGSSSSGNGGPSAGYVRIFGDALPVRAAIVNLAGYSAHADQNELLRWLGTLQSKPTLYAVHGDPDAVAVFDRVVKQRLGLDAAAGTRGTSVDL